MQRRRGDRERPGETQAVDGGEEIQDQVWEGPRQGCPGALSE